MRPPASVTRFAVAHLTVAEACPAPWERFLGTPSDRPRSALGRLLHSAFLRNGFAPRRRPGFAVIAHTSSTTFPMLMPLWRWRSAAGAPAKGKRRPTRGGVRIRRSISPKARGRRSA